MRPSPTAVLAACAFLAAAPKLALAEADPLGDPGVRAVRQAFPILGISLLDTRARGAGCADHAASGLVWCATGTAYETSEGGTYARSLGYNLDAAGRVVYVILTRREYPLARDKFDETVKALCARYGRAVLEQPGRFGSHLGKVTLDVDKTAAGARIVDRWARVLPVENVAPDAAFLEAMRPFHEATLKYVQTPVGSTIAPFEGGLAARFSDSAVADLVNEAQAEAARRAGFPVEASMAPVFWRQPSRAP